MNCNRLLSLNPKIYEHFSPIILLITKLQNFYHVNLSLRILMVLEYIFQVSAYVSAIFHWLLVYTFSPDLQLNFHLYHSHGFFFLFFSQILLEYNDCVQRAQRLGLAREAMLCNNESGQSVVKQDDLLIYLRWLVCHLHSLKRVNQYLKVSP